MFDLFGGAFGNSNAIGRKEGGNDVRKVRSKMVEMGYKKNGGRKKGRKQLK